MNLIFDAAVVYVVVKKIVLPCISPYFQIPSVIQVALSSAAPMKLSSSAPEEPIELQYTNMEKLEAAIRTCGRECSQLSLFIDFTSSNEDQGYRTFNRKSLHAFDNENPYELAITAVVEKLGKFDSDGKIQCFGFGDETTRDQAVFEIGPSDGLPLKDILTEYRSVAQKVKLSGPTSFAPSFAKAIELCEQQHRGYGIAIILTDGATQSLRTDLETLRKASEYPISFIVVGVGDGPWDSIHALDVDSNRSFDNLTVVCQEKFLEINGRLPKTGNIEYRLNTSRFALEALKEIPAQFDAIKKLDLFSGPPAKGPWKFF